jgi:hypothetical protein
MLQTRENLHRSRNVENVLSFSIHVSAENTDFSKSADICTITATTTTLVHTVHISDSDFIWPYEHLRNSLSR